MSATEQRIREYAYQIWQAEGCPDGQDIRHWDMACKLCEAEEKGATNKPAGRPRKTATKPVDVTPTESKPKRARSAASKSVSVNPSPSDVIPRATKHTPSASKE